jgi:hypothetical protein
MRFEGIGARSPLFDWRIREIRCEVDWEFMGANSSRFHPREDPGD